MATERNLPIKFFQKRENDESSVEGMGDNTLPKWVNKDTIYEKSIEFREILSEVGTKLEAKVANNNNVPTVVRLKLYKTALAKNSRREVSNIFNVDKKLNVFGFNGSEELLIKIDNKHDLTKIISNFSKSENSNLNNKIILGICSINELQIYIPEVDLELNPKEKIKVKLFNYGNFNLNSIALAAFEKFCEQNNINISRTAYSADLNIYSVNNITLDSLELLKEFDGIQMISGMPVYDVSFDHINEEEPVPIRVPQQGKDYPVVGILDSGVASIPHLKPWLMDDSITYYDDSVVNKEHGTFVAGVLLYGDELQGKNYTGLDGCRIFEAIVIPDKNKQSISEEELVFQIRDAISRNNHIKIWNLSLGTKSEADLHEFSDFAKALDEIMEENNVLICKSAGNCENFTFRAPKSRISRSADTIRGLVVGSLAHEQSATDESQKHHASPFSRKGPGPAYSIKPDLTHIGGNGGLDNRNNTVYSYVKSFAGNGSSASSVGTSFSTPRVTAIAAGVNFMLKEEFNPILLKALLVHSAKYPHEMEMDIIEKMKQVGFGLPANITDILYNEPNEITLILNDRLEKGSFIDILDFPFPSSMIDENGYYYGEVTITLVTSPILDVNQGSEYCQSNISAMFGSYDKKVPVDLTKPGKKNPISALNRKNILATDCYSSSKNKIEDDGFTTERMMLSYGSNFHPVKKWSVNLDEFTQSNKDKYLKGPKNWYLKLEGLYRHALEEKAEVDAIKPFQDFCCIVTIKDSKKRGNIYNEVTGLLNNFNFIHSNVKINQQVDIRLNNNNGNN
jgi:hypothetical protein